MSVNVSAVLLVLLGGAIITLVLWRVARTTAERLEHAACLYRERNLLALAWIQAVYRENVLSGFESDMGWWDDAESGDEWAVVWIDESWGQFGWHVPREMVPEWLDEKDPEYDGYSTADKYERLRRGWVDMEKAERVDGNAPE